MTRLRVEPLAPPPNQTPESDTDLSKLKLDPVEFQRPPAPEETVEGKLFQVTVAAFTGLGYALSARAILLLAIIGAFVLGVMVMQTPTVVRACALAIYAVLVVIPCCILEVRKR